MVAPSAFVTGRRQPPPRVSFSRCTAFRTPPVHQPGVHQRPDDADRHVQEKRCFILSAYFNGRQALLNKRRRRAPLSYKQHAHMHTKHTHRMGAKKSCDRAVAGRRAPSSENWAGWHTGRRQRNPGRPRRESGEEERGDARQRPSAACRREGGRGGSAGYVQTAWWRRGGLLLLLPCAAAAAAAAGGEGWLETATAKKTETHARWGHRGAAAAAVASSSSPRPSSPSSPSPSSSSLSNHQRVGAWL